MVRLVPRPALTAPGVSPETPGRRAAAELPSLTAVPIVAAGLLVAAAALAPAAVRVAALPLSVGGALLGVPHGAVDHLVLRWSGIPGRRVSMALLLPAYLTVSLLAAACLLLAPDVTVLSFLLLSALHFGTAETAFALERRGGATPQPWREPLASAAHGAAVVGLLLWARPDDASSWVRQLAPRAADAVTAAAGVGLAVTVTLIAASGVLSLVRGQVLAAAELVVLVVLFTTTPALAAFGVYFGGWHALRHTGRLLDVAREPGDVGWRPAVRRLARASVLPSTAALATVAGLVLVRDRAPLLAEVAVLLALTYPHAAVVWSADTWRHGRAASAIKA